jgi:aconitate hydratase
VPQSQVDKVLESHIIEGEPVPGERVAIKINQTLTQDATGTMAYLQLEAMGVNAVKTELSVSYVDHNTLQSGFENADDHVYLKDVAEKLGIYYSRAGNGICHQVHLERFGAPGKTLLGSDSHTPTGGGIGMFAVGAGGLDVAVAMAGGPFWLTFPRVVGVHLTGKLQPWVSAKDVILHVLSVLTTKGNVGTVLEYFGPGVETLSVPERATITNMGAELGVTTSVFPSDEVTRRFLQAQERADVWVPLAADENAEYSRVIELDLSEIVPMVATPHSPDNVSTVADVAGLDVDQVCIGSCTNSSYKDLATVAEILRGEKVHPNVSLIVAPGSRQVLQMITADGHVADYIAAGARLAESACGFCIGMGQAPKTDAVSVRTNNRNFYGRSGTPSAGVYLVSPETAAAAAITGKLIDPRELDKDYPVIELPERFIVDDSMIIHVHNPGVEIRRGPNIGPPPENVPLPEPLVGEVLLKVGDKITTDHIMPAGPRLKYRSNIETYSGFVFEGVDPTFAERAKEKKAGGVYGFVVSGESYGQGSSREHAAMCPMHLGVKAVFAKSLERIHTANLVNFGILPLTFRDPGDYDNIDADDILEIQTDTGKLTVGKPVTVINKTKGTTFDVNHNLDAREIAIIRAGGLLNYTKE